MVKEKKAPMKRVPKKDIDLNALENFAAEANHPVQDKASESKQPASPSDKVARASAQSALPWEQEGINEKVIVPFNLRPNEPTSLKLKFIVKHLPDYKSVHDFCMKTVLEKVDQELSKLLK